MAALASSNVQDAEPDLIFRAAGKYLWDGQGTPPRLSVLDAGTGRSSLGWLLRSGWVGSWAAVTASAAMERDVAETLRAAPADAPPGRVVRATWDDAECMRGEVFDVVVADYLLGSVDGFTPYRQDALVERLLEHLKPGGALLFVGLEPIPNAAPPPHDVVPLCARLRDAVFLHAGQRPYREYPLQWVLRALLKAGLVCELTRRFPIIYSANDLCKELNTARARLPLVEARSGAAFARALGAHIDEVEARTRDTLAQQPGGRLGYGEDYLVCARLPSPV
ncbi:hypothetical protein T492DRAFT_1038963 [Pavlovales sp. CCMP2436]|nr:hypothetical protein T492DRAFT_1038963 [Pavlovales sp. CCMP2436]|mmetsp:Transcript_21185/g.50196  ORF Transcript_21185/g.50196 Transcript_21185/m.50196 type:complete len:279 (-) Transcript_21185:148-984(-)